MKTVILCGGLGTRLAEETEVRPKPMVTIGGKPILWHIMEIYSRHGHKDFVLALGYMGDVIKSYFLNYHALSMDFTVNLADGKVNFDNQQIKRDWLVKLVETGKATQTGGRLLRLRDSLAGEDTFMLTYGDGVSNVNINDLLKFHKSHGKVATVTTVRPTARFGGLEIDAGKVTQFKEKHQSGSGWINGGFFVFDKRIFEYLEDDTTVLETAPMENLVKGGQLMAYQHEKFWQCMDTIRERNFLEDLWATGDAPWTQN